jgi:hypothetical protein
MISGKAQFVVPPLGGIVWRHGMDPRPTIPPKGGTTSRFSDKLEGLPLYEAIILKTLLPFIDEMVEEGLVTLEDVRVIQYRGPRAP